jgi:hypothetical protein
MMLMATRLQNLARALEEFKKERTRLEASTRSLEARLERMTCRFLDLRAQHMDLVDILRLLSLSAIDRQRILGAERIRLVGMFHICCEQCHRLDLNMRASKSWERV